MVPDRPASPGQWFVRLLACVNDGRVTPGRLHADEVEIDAELARGLLREQMPEFSALPLLRVVSGGTENAVFRLGDELAVRMPMTPGAVGGLLKEVRWLPVLAGHLSLDVPEVLAVGAPAERYPFPWTVVRWLTGEEALTGRIESMGEVCVGLGRFVAELQGIDITGAPPPGSEGFVRGLPPVWLHADLIPGTVLVRDGRLAGVLDFGAMATGDPAYDITAAWHLLDGASRAAFCEVVEPDEATCRRARGLVVSGAVIALPYYLHSNPSMVATARRGIEQVLADLD
jgi:aminoglycoside phosphotransferase (APT) family kinase protein